MPKCKDHPDAPHGFCRNESHTLDRYVCECEYWEPEVGEFQKIVINRCYGGFGLSTEGMLHYANLKGMELKVVKDPIRDSFYDENGEYFTAYEIARDDPYLVKTIEDLGEYANGAFSELKVVEIPLNVVWVIGEYDGIEWVAEQHRTWS